MLSPYIESPSRRQQTPYRSPRVSRTSPIARRPLGGAQGDVLARQVIIVAGRIAAVAVIARGGGSVTMTATAPTQPHTRALPVVGVIGERVEVSGAMRAGLQHAAQGSGQLPYDADGRGAVRLATIRASVL